MNREELLEQALRELLLSLSHLSYVAIRLIPDELTPLGSELKQRIIDSANAAVRASNLLDDIRHGPEKDDPPTTIQ